MKPVVVQIEIDRPAEVVWEYLENAEHNPEWLSNMRSARWTTDPPIRVGSRYEQVARFLGKEVRTRFEVTALDPGRLITIASLPGSSFPLEITRSVEPLGLDRCRACETAGGDSRAFYRVADPVMRPIVRRNIARAYRRLKEMLEARVRS
ncbi:MAG TPA: SRPBCC family protein [Solirubrobacteraceae bacterium]|nr:SRPBCC family protein [Solirubrobacteraceae bacterium]